MDYESSHSDAGGRRDDIDRTSDRGDSDLRTRLARLCDAAHRASGSPLSNRAIAEGLTEQGTPVSASFIGYLRDGRRDNPTKKVLEGLAAYFEVPVAYFFDDAVAERLDSQIELLTAMRDSDIRTVATRMPELKPETRRWLARQIGAFKAMEQGTWSENSDGDDQGDGSSESRGVNRP